MRSGHRLAVVSSAILLLVSPVSSSAAAGPDRPAHRFTEFSSVDMVGPSDGWIVGFQDGKTLAERWDGAGWTIVPTMNLPVGRGYIQQLVSVSASSANDAWAVGSAESQNNRKVIIERWDGQAWRLVPCELPPRTTFTRLSSVVDIAPDDVWIVGTNHTADSEDTLALHWDGSTCTFIPTRNPGDKQGNVFDAVSASGPNDVWAVGQSFKGFYPKTLAEHWDGHAWSVVTTPNPGHSGGELLTVTNTSPDEAWAAGWCWTHRRAGQASVTMHWDGTSWHFVHSVNPRRGLYDASSIDAANAEDVWAVGSTYLHDVGEPLAERWTGSRWVNAHAARVSGRVVEVNATSVVAGDDVWMVGGVGNYHHLDGLIEHWNGHRWQVLTS